MVIERPDAGRRDRCRVFRVAAMAALAGLLGHGSPLGPVIGTARADPGSGASLDRSQDMSRVPGGILRTLQGRAADSFNAKDYGAFGTGTAHPLGATLGVGSLAGLAAWAASDGSHPYAWATQPAFGLSFSLPLGTAAPRAGRVLTFPVPAANTATGPISTGYNYAAQADVVLPGMIVGGVCVPAGTSVAAVATALPLSVTTIAAQPATGPTLALPFTAGIVAGEAVTGPGIPAGDTVLSVSATAVTLAVATTAAMPAGTALGFTGAGTVWLSAATSAACAAGSPITFSLADTQVQSLDMDWLGIEAAVAAAWSQPYGGAVHIPRGDYLVSRMVVNPGITDSNDSEPQIEIFGDGMLSTRLTMTADTGAGSCAFGEGNRSQNSVSRSDYHGFRLIGPGTVIAYGVSPAAMDGLCIGEKARVQRLLATRFHAGINLMRDHQVLDSVETSADYFGLEFAANSDTFGNQHFIADSFTGTLGAMAIAWNGSVQSANFDNVSLGFGPYSLYREAAPLGSPPTLPMITHSTMTGIYGESIGNGFIYGENGAADTISSNAWIGVSPTLDPTGAYRLPGRAPLAVVTAGTWFENTLLGSDFGSGINYGTVTDAIFEIANTVQASKWLDPISSTNLIRNATKPIFKAGTMLFNTFAMDRASGEFRRAEAPVAAGQVVAFGQWGYGGGAVPMRSGLVPLGVSLTGGSAGSVIAIARSGLAVTSKAAGVALTQGQPVAVSPDAPASVTSLANGAGGPVIGVVADAANVAAAATAVSIDLHPTP